MRIAFWTQDLPVLQLATHAICQHLHGGMLQDRGLAQLEEVRHRGRARDLAISGHVLTLPLPSHVALLRTGLVSQEIRLDTVSRDRNHIGLAFTSPRVGGDLDLANVRHEVGILPGSISFFHPLLQQDHVLLLARRRRTHPWVDDPIVTGPQQLLKSLLAVDVQMAQTLTG